MASIPITYEYRDGRCYATGHLPNGESATVSVPTQPIVQKYVEHDPVGALDIVGAIVGDDMDVVGGVDIVGATDMICGALEDELDEDEVGGKASRKARRKRRRTRIKSKLKKVGSAVKKVAKSKLGKAFGKILKAVPIYGQVFAAATGVAKGINKGVQKAKKVVRGVRTARKAAGGRLLGGKGKLRDRIKNIAKGVAAAKTGLKLPSGTVRAKAEKIRRKRSKKPRKPRPAPTVQTRPKRAKKTRAGRGRARASASGRKVLRVKKKVSGSRGKGLYKVTLPDGRPAEVRLV